MIEEEGVNQKFHRLGVLLLLDCPQGLEFGIDNISWQVGNKFKGIKMIPLGTHIIAYSLKSQNNMFKISRFLLFTQQERIMVCRWNEQVSQFLQMKGEEAQGYKLGVNQYHFDSHLGPYPEQNYAFWSRTTQYIIKPVLDKLDPIDKMQQFQQQYSNKNLKKDAQIQMAKMSLDDQDDQEQIINEEEEEHVEQEEQKARENPGKFKVLSDTIYYSEISRTLIFSPEQVTLVNLDKTPILKKIIKVQWKNHQQYFLGQLQYSFVHFIIGQAEQSLAQWKKIVNLLVFSESAYLIIQQKQKDINLQKLILDFIPILYDQLNQFPTDFFRDELSKDNFMCVCLKRLHQYSKGEEYSLKIKKRIEKLQLLIKKKFQFEVDSGQEDDQDKPIVLNENQSYF